MEAFKLCLKEVKIKLQPTPGLEILEDECLESSVQRLQIKAEFQKWQTPIESFEHLNFSTSQADLNMAQTRADKIFSAKALKGLINKL